MRITGIILVGLGAWWMSVVWQDPVEGVYMRIFCGAMILAGVVCYAEGIKRDIIEAVRVAATNKPSTGASPQPPPDKRG